MNSKRRSPGHLAAMLAGRKRQRAERPLSVRFWEKVERRGLEECWPWRGGIAGNGYGQIFRRFEVQPDGTQKGKNAQAHRVAWELSRGPIPAGLVIDHACKNIICCNPVHLRPVPQEENCTIYSRPTPWTKNMAKTTCLRGHPFDVFTNRAGRPHRDCSICIEIRRARGLEQQRIRRSKSRQGT